MASEKLEPGRLLEKIRRQLASTSPLMEALADLMIVSEIWRKDEKVHVVAWIPDIHEGRPRYKKKHIVYHIREDYIEVRDVAEHREAEGMVPA